MGTEHLVSLPTMIDSDYCIAVVFVLNIKQPSTLRSTTDSCEVAQIVVCG